MVRAGTQLLSGTHDAIIRSLPLVEVAPKDGFVALATMTMRL